MVAKRSGTTPRTPVRSPATIAGAAAVTQLSESSPVRFSKGRKTIRRAGSGPREQAADTANIRTAAKRLRELSTPSRLKNLLFHGHELLELFVLMQESEFGLFFELIALLEALFDRLPDVLKRS